MISIKKQNNQEPKEKRRQEKLSGGQAGGKKASVIWWRSRHNQKICLSLQWVVGSSIQRGMSCNQEEQEYEVRSPKRSGGKRCWSYQMEMESAPPGSDLQPKINDQCVLLCLIISPLQRLLEELFEVIMWLHDNLWIMTAGNLQSPQLYSSNHIQ